jgi:chloramphenicol O-acetyltransferase type B
MDSAESDLTKQPAVRREGIGRRAKKIKGAIARRVLPEAKSARDRYPQFAIGQHSYGFFTVHDYGEGVSLEIGDYCSIAHDVTFILGGEHQSRFVSTYPFGRLFPQTEGVRAHPRIKGDIRIGNDVWIGRNAMILSGVTIGDGAIVGAGAVVGNDVPPYGIAIGVPAQTARRRFPDETIQQLLGISWWKWPEARVEAAVPYLMSRDIQAFISGCHAGKF